MRTNLVDWTDLPKMEKKQAESETRKQQTPSLATRQRHQHRPKGKGLCCCGKRPVSPEDEEDRIVHAFRKMDPNNTGYVSWKEFKKVFIFIFLENVKRIYFPPNQDSFFLFSNLHYSLEIFLMKQFSECFLLKWRGCQEDFPWGWQRWRWENNNRRSQERSQ